MHTVYFPKELFYPVEIYRGTLYTRVYTAILCFVLGAVASARANAEGFSGRKASPEWSPADCQPCASL
jgi:hypothetical protein